MTDDYLLQARAAAASNFALRSSNVCPSYEGMLKVETHGEQRVRQLLYRQVFVSFPLMWLLYPNLEDPCESSFWIMVPIRPVSAFSSLLLFNKEVMCQAIWLPAYCVLKDGVVTCSKDKRHTKVVDAFDMSETRSLSVEMPVFSGWCTGTAKCRCQAEYRYVAARQGTEAVWDAQGADERSKFKDTPLFCQHRKRRGPCRVPGLPLLLFCPNF